MGKTKTLLLVILLTFVLPALSLLVPAPPHVAYGEIGFHIAVVTSVIFAWLYIGAAWLFLVGLNIFKLKLQRAYQAICIGLVITGLASLQYPVLAAFDLWLTDWAKLAQVPYLLGAIAILVGTRLFDQALGDKAKWASLTYTILPVIVVVSLLGWFVDSGDGFWTVASDIALALLFGAAVVMAFRIKKLTSVVYANALAWFFIATAMNAFAMACPLIFDILHTTKSPVITIPIMIAGILYIKAGYAFNKIKDY